MGTLSARQGLRVKRSFWLFCPASAFHSDHCRKRFGVFYGCLSFRLLPWLLHRTGNTFRAPRTETHSDCSCPSANTRAAFTLLLHLLNSLASLELLELVLLVPVDG